MSHAFKTWEDVRDEHRKYADDSSEDLEVTEDIVDLPLRTMRKMARLTQAEVADLIGCDQSEVSRIENRNDYMFSTLLRYVEALGGELEVLVHIEGKTVRLSDE